MTVFQLVLLGQQQTKKEKKRKENAEKKVS